QHLVVERLQLSIDLFTRRGGHPRGATTDPREARAERDGAGQQHGDTSEVAKSCHEAAPFRAAVISMDSSASAGDTFPSIRLRATVMASMVARVCSGVAAAAASTSFGWMLRLTGSMSAPSCNSSTSR